MRLNAMVQKHITTSAAHDKTWKDCNDNNLCHEIYVFKMFRVVLKSPTTSIWIVFMYNLPRFNSVYLLELFHNITTQILMILHDSLLLHPLIHTSVTKHLLLSQRFEHIRAPLWSNHPPVYYSETILLYRLLLLHMVEMCLSGISKLAPE